MSFTSKGSAEIIVAGVQDAMLIIDLNKGEVVRQASLLSLCCTIYRARRAGLTKLRRWPLTGNTP